MTHSSQWDPSCVCSERPQNYTHPIVLVPILNKQNENKIL